MSPPKLRQLSVSVQEVADALDSQGDDPEYFLDTDTGEVLPWIDPMITGEENPFDPDDGRYVAIPRRESRDEYRDMDAFVESIKDIDVQAILFRALSGKGAFRRFRETLRDYPNLQQEWDRRRSQQLQQEALAWLAEVGFQPEQEPDLPPPAPGAEPSIGLVDLLLLGGPAGKTERLEGRVHRVFVAADPQEAREAFDALVRELAATHGRSPRELLRKDDRVWVDRFELSLSGTRIELAVAVPQTTWDAFSRGG